MTEVFKGATSQSFFVVAVDSSTGLKKTGLVYTDVTGAYDRVGSASVDITMASLASASAAYVSGGWVEVSASKHPGLYRVDGPNAAFVAGVPEVAFSFTAPGATIMPRAFTLVDWNKQVAAIPNAAAGTNGGLPTGDADAAVKVQGDLTETMKASVTTAVWDAARDSHVVADSFGEFVPANAIRLNGALIDGSPDITDRPILYLGGFDVYCNSSVRPAVSIANDDAHGDATVMRGGASAHDLRLNGSGTMLGAIEGTVSGLDAKLGTPAGASLSADVAAVKSDTASLLSRIGAFTGSGVNTVLGFLKAALSKTASTPSDVGGTFSAATDSLEAVSEGVAGVGASAGDATAANQQDILEILQSQRK